MLESAFSSSLFTYHRHRFHRWRNSVVACVYTAGMKYACSVNVYHYESRSDDDACVAAPLICSDSDVSCMFRQRWSTVNPWAHKYPLHAIRMNKKPSCRKQTARCRIACYLVRYLNHRWRNDFDFYFGVHFYVYAEIYQEFRYDHLALAADRFVFATR